MGGANTSLTHSLERSSPRLFLAAGALLIVYASLNGLSVFADLATKESGVEFGYVLGFLGLLGLYPSLVHRSPWLVRSGAAAAISGIVGITAISAVEVAQLVGITLGTPSAWPLFVFLALVGFILGYLSFGVAILRTGRYSKSIGYLVLIPGIIVVFMFVHIAVGFASDLTAFVISAGEAMAHLAIGATLRTESSQTARDVPSNDSDAEVTTHE